MLSHSLKRFLVIAVLSLIVFLSSCSRETVPIISNITLFGAYVRGDSSFDVAAINQLEKDLDHSLDIVQWFNDFNDPWEPNLVLQAVGNSHIPMITWQPTDHSLDDILAGNDDAYLRAWAQGAKSFKKSVYVRLMPEMNGDWVSWSGDGDKYIKAWRYVVNLFRSEGASNVKWIWAPNCMDGPRNDPAYFMESYYPGPDYVDVIGLSGFNWGDVEKKHIWRSYEDIFIDAYTRLNKISDHKFWIVETASAEDGLNSQRKATWIKNTLSSTAFPKVEAMIWFNEYKEKDWRVQSSQAALNAFREILDATYDDRAALASLYR